MMQTKRLTALFAIVTAISITLLTFSTNAVAEQGTATLQIYTDPERKTLVELDSNGRYYVVPGTEYYFNVSYITEYGIGESITIWAYRANTTENITITTFEVSSTPFDAIFSWTIPDEWLDEIVKIKYGTNLEDNWFYAQKEIWVNARVGTGILYVYTDTWCDNEAPLEDNKHYLVLPKTKYYFTIDGITEYTSGKIKIWGRYEHVNEFIGEFYAARRISFSWEIPDLPINTEIKIKYGTEPTGCLPNWYYARRATQAAPRSLFVIPEIPLGVLGVTIALFSGLGIKVFHRKKKEPKITQQ
jgi:hypothetical protein